MDKAIVTLGPSVLWWVAQWQWRLRLWVWQWCRRSLVYIHRWFIILFLLSQTWVMGLLMTLWKAKILLKYRRTTTMLIRWVWSIEEPPPMLYMFWFQAIWFIVVCNIICYIHIHLFLISNPNFLICFMFVFV